MPRKITRDHAKKKQRPMVEDRVIAEHLTALLTPAITSQCSLAEVTQRLEICQNKLK